MRRKNENYKRVENVLQNNECECQGGTEGSTKRRMGILNGAKYDTQE